MLRIFHTLLSYFGFGEKSVSGNLNKKEKKGLRRGDSRAAYEGRNRTINERGRFGVLSKCKSDAVIVPDITTSPFGMDKYSIAEASLHACLRMVKACHDAEYSPITTDTVKENSRIWIEQLTTSLETLLKRNI